MLQTFPLDGKIVCHEIVDGDEAEETALSPRSMNNHPARSASATHRR
jgi:hypothetical protein